MGFVDVRLLIAELHLVLVGYAFVDEKCCSCCGAAFFLAEVSFLAGVVVF